MKKILFFSLLIFLIPIVIVVVLRTNKEIEFKYFDDMFIRVKRSSGNIENIRFENYIVGVIAGEMPTSFELEALKAQAVASRSYAMVLMKRNQNNDYDVVDTVGNQVYLDNAELKEKWNESYINKINKIKKAVSETRGEYLTYNDEIVEAMFFSTSSGVTENSEEIFSSKKEYLRSVSSMWDEISPVFSETNEFTLSNFYSLLSLPYKNNLEYKITKQTSTGRIKEIDINGNLIDGGVFTKLLKLRSNFFSIKQNNEKIIIITKGYGHGVGMSQYGAQGMALSGYKYDDILKHYYQGVIIEKL